MQDGSELSWQERHYCEEAPCRCNARVPSKAKIQGFMHEIPVWMIESFELRASQLDSKRQGRRLVSSASGKRDTRVQSMGERTLSKTAKESQKPRSKIFSQVGGYATNQSMRTSSKLANDRQL